MLLFVNPAKQLYLDEVQRIVGTMNLVIPPYTRMHSYSMDGARDESFMVAGMNDCPNQYTNLFSFFTSNAMTLPAHGCLLVTPTATNIQVQVLTSHQPYQFETWQVKRTEHRISLVRPNGSFVSFS
jgi:hypothetical protein